MAGWHQVVPVRPPWCPPDHAAGHDSLLRGPAETRGPRRSFLLAQLSRYYLGTFALVIVLGGPLFEEIGWRGFALPRMERLHGPLLASLILGVLWALWHLPEFLVPSWAASSGGGGIVGITLFTLTAITFTIVITWVFNNTRASVLPAILVHTSIDAFTVPLGAMFSARAVSSALPLIIGFGVVGVVLIVLTRGHLSYGRLVEAQSAPRAG